MLINILMEGETIASDNLISPIKDLNSDGKEHGTIKALLRNFILPESDKMAIKENQSDNSKCVYTVPIKLPPSARNDRTKTINEAKQAFLNSTVDKTVHLRRNDVKSKEPTLHYAQIAITTESEDTRSTGGGKDEKQLTNKSISSTDIPLNIKKKIEQQQRKVSFKIKTVSTSYKRQSLATKSTVTITSSKVSELTKKFNDLMKESHDKTKKQTKLAMTIEDLQSVTRRSPSNNSTPSSTLSSSPNIKILVRQRRGSKKRNSRKRCSSVDSIDKLLLSDNTSAKIRVIRSKSDGTKAPKSPKKRLKQQITNEEVKGFDDVDGNPTKIIDTKSTKSIEKKVLENNVVKSVIKKFESEITAQSNSNNTLRKHPEHNKQPAVIKEKPKVPEKKSSLVLTKNLVVKDGVPKIKTIKPVLNESLPKQDNNLVIPKKKEPLYDKKKYKTNYIHSDKMSLHVVEIIQEDISENIVSTTEKPNNIVDSLKSIEEKNPNEPDITVVNTNRMEIEGTSYQEISSPLAPNESFLWRRKNSTQIYSDSEKSMSDTYSPFVSLTVNETSIVISEESQISDKIESHDISASDVKVDLISHEDSLIEAYNKDVLVGLTPKPEKAQVMEDDYEVLEPRNPEEIVVVPVKSENRNSKINCPLPEIPKEETPESPEKDGKENIYQCLLEMRSHPEGDESSLHSYELCNNHLEERTRGDGDSDDGYEYCKSPIKPYCMTSSSGIQIAEDYQPNCPNNNDKNYAISKSVSGTSTISYEKIGCDRIYEKIPCQTPKSKESSPNYSKRHSYVSSDYTTYNDTENIYDTIKHADGTSLSHCYESIPNSPSMVKLRNNLKKQLNSTVQKRLSFDTVSNISQSTLSSEQKTNSIYGQRSMISYNGQEIAFQVPSSETSVSDRSDRSDDWVDVSDEEKNDEQKIIIVREKNRGRKSPVSWSQKVRHQWQKTPKQSKDDNDCDSSDSGHLYESLELAPAPPAVPAPPMHPAPPPLPYEEDTDSFDSDSDYDEHEKSTQRPPSPLLNSRLPSPPSAGGQHTLTKIANAAQRKMKQIKRNLTKRYSVAMDGKSFIKSSSTNQSNGVYGTTATKSKTKTPIYANCEKPDTQHVYTNVNFNETRPAINKTENPVAKANGSFKEELKNVIGEKRPGSGDVPPPLPEKPPPEKPTTPTSENSKKDSGTLSRKTYFSFKSRFRRASSLAIDASSEVPSALKITNSTFYLTDSMDGDSGFSNCSDSGQPGSAETLSPGAQARRRDGRLRPGWAESSPCLAPLERPSVPPPPPPTDLSAVNEELKRLLPTLSRKDKTPRARTSWYAECGADSTPASASNASWYAEAGLYQAGNISSSSGASSDSHPGSPLPHSLFTHEPLYQFYNAAKVESVCRETGDSDSEAYEAGSSGGSQSRASPAPVARPSAMALVAPRGPARTLWCEVPEVLSSAVLSSLAPAQKRLQEAKFELLTSEASYLNSLNVLEAHFISHPAFRDPHVLPPAHWETLFATILPVRKCSQQLMAELERCWQENILLAGICDIVRAHAEKHFHVYVKYCENQALMVRALQRLRDRPAFAAALKRLESAPACQSLSLHSFLMLPMQRVTRLPLLLDAVLKNLSDGDDEYQSCMHALATLNDFVSQCNEGARNTERVEEMFRLAQHVEFPAGVRNPPALGPACSRRDRQPVRWLVRSGEVIQLLWKTDELKLTFGKKFHKVPLHLFLFNDLLVITKKKGEESYIAVDHCSRSLLEVCASEATAGAKHALLLTLLENHEGRTLEMLVSCPSETDASRWAEALAPPPAGAGEAVYAGWDCPQVAALYAYAPTQPDELALSEGDVVNVTRKTSEGWYYGERTRDGEAGWFPGAYTAEIASAHVRARNLRQRYRLLALSGTYLGQKKRPT